MTEREPQNDKKEGIIASPDESERGNLRENRVVICVIDYFRTIEDRMNKFAMGEKGQSRLLTIVCRMAGVVVLLTTATTASSELPARRRRAH